jgi:hypothetical protein
MGKLDSKWWIIAVLWESLPSSLQEWIRKWAWDMVLGAIGVMAYFAWSAFQGTQGLAWEMKAAMGAFIFACIAAGVHFISLWWHRRKNRETPKPLRRSEHALVQLPTQRAARTIWAVSLFGSGIQLERSQSDGTLVFYLKNAGNPEPIRDCRVFITGFQIWSENLQKFGVIKEIDKQPDLFPFLIHGPDDLYLDQPVVCYFIETSDKKKALIKSVESQNASQYMPLPQLAGIWCAHLRIQASGEEYQHRACFEWFPGQSLKFIKCPDYSLADL